MTIKSEEKEVQPCEEVKDEAVKEAQSILTKDTENEACPDILNYQTTEVPMEMDNYGSTMNYTSLLNKSDKNLNFSKKDGVSRVIDGGENGTLKEVLEMNDEMAPNDFEPKKLVEKSEVTSSVTGDSTIQSQSNISAEDHIDLLILNNEDLEVELDRLIIEENAQTNLKKKKLKKRLKRKMKRHIKRFAKMTVVQKQKYEQAKDSLLKKKNKNSFNLKEELTNNQILSKTSNEVKEVREAVLSLNKDKHPKLECPEKEEQCTKYNEHVFDLKAGLKKNFKLKIADLGNGCWTHYHFQPEIQTRQYRGPEVILGINYNETADLWSFACMIFEMLTGDFLFDPKKSNDFKKNDDHLAQMIELLNEFPRNWSTIGTNSKRYFDKDGKLKKIKTLRFWGLKDILMQRYKMAEHEAIALEDFLLPMLRILPQERATAEEMINHHWLDMPGDNYKNKDPTNIPQNDEERFHKVINEVDEYGDISRSARDLEAEEVVEDEEDDDFVIEGNYLTRSLRQGVQTFRQVLQKRVCWFRRRYRPGRA